MSIAARFLCEKQDAGLVGAGPANPPSPKPRRDKDEGDAAGGSGVGGVSGKAIRLRFSHVSDSGFTIRYAESQRNTLQRVYVHRVDFFRFIPDKSLSSQD